MTHNANVLPANHTQTPPTAELSRKPIRPSRRGVKAIAAVLLATTATACTSTAPTNNEGPLTIRNEHTSTAPGSPSNSNKTSAPTSETPVWPNVPAESLTFPGRVALGLETCERWTPESPQPTFVRSGKLFTIIDARNSYPPECDYKKDSGAAVYKGASYDSGYVPQPEGKFVPNGTIVHVNALSIGQKACNPNGSSEVWLQITRDDSENTAFVHSTNVGFAINDQVPGPVTLPIIPSVYRGSTLPSC